MNGGLTARSGTGRYSRMQKLKEERHAIHDPTHRASRRRGPEKRGGSLSADLPTERILKDADRDQGNGEAHNTKKGEVHHAHA